MSDVPGGSPGPVDERVRPCLDCGTILPFDAEICSLCGERYAAGRIDAEAVKPCLACDAIIPARHLFCPECGDFTLEIHVDRDNLTPLGAREGRVMHGTVRALAVAAVGTAALLAIVAALDLAAVTAIGR